MSKAGSISTLARAKTIDVLERDEFDLAVIGGGITGAGVAHEACSRGLSVALLEAADFAAGTSSRSSKLIHGGLRYLAMGDIALVRETALERKEIFRIAPHLAEPRWMVLPTRSRRGMLKFRAGIATYEKLGAVDERDGHRNWFTADLEREEPLVERSRYPFAIAYREYLTDDARLVLANLRGAVGCGAAVLNYAPVTGLLLEGESARGVRARCAESGREFRVRARCVVNAAGPWVEAVLRLGWPDAPEWLHLSKGIHVSLPGERLPLRNMVMVQAQDGRTIFAIRRGEVTYVGTTDTSYGRGADLWPEITPEDVEYLLEPLPRYFALDPFRLEDVVGAWAGLRPLVGEPGKKPTEISRRDEVRVGPAGLVSIAGGKLTGYRPMAAAVLERVARVLGQSLPAARGDGVLPGGAFDGDLERLRSRLSARAGAPPEAVRRLARLYGSEGEAVLARGAESLVTGAGILSGEVDWAVREEGAVSVEDVLYRRNRAALWSPGIAAAAAAPTAARMAELLGWSGDRTEREVASLKARLRQDLAFGGLAR